VGTQESQEFLWTEGLGVKEALTGVALLISELF
jgi:hypothetical protein